jgi:hypothetical protein
LLVLLVIVVVDDGLFVTDVVVDGGVVVTAVVVDDELFVADFVVNEGLVVTAVVVDDGLFLIGGRMSLLNALNVIPTNSACRSELNSQKNAPPNRFCLI